MIHYYYMAAGKTTTLWKIADLLSENNKKVGLITNDQASELVDTAILSKIGGAISEVSGSCFCCNFNGFIDAVTQMYQTNKVDYIIAEPVGSCTDLSATILQPLKDKWRDEIDICPLNVLIDPVRLKAILDGNTSGLHKSAAYIIQKQLEEADYIVINKIDLLKKSDVNSLIERASNKWTQAKIYAISAQTGENMSNWVADFLSSTKAGTHLAQVDYDIYAEGEAVLGWLNASISLKSKNTDWSDYAEALLKNLNDRFKQKGASIGHVKLMIQYKDKYIIGNITGTNQAVSMRGFIGESQKVDMTFNARVEMEPEELKKIVLEELHKTYKDKVRYDVSVQKCLQPGRPNPTHRYEKVVG
jgi:Ni2+-binding GTPase involved in maturation of urease and hydrogenase